MLDTVCSFPERKGYCLPKRMKGWTVFVDQDYLDLKNTRKIPVELNPGICTHFGDLCYNYTYRE